MFRKVATRLLYEIEHQRGEMPYVYPSESPPKEIPLLRG